jgi:hypothetical protein
MKSAMGFKDYINSDSSELTESVIDNSTDIDMHDTGRIRVNFRGGLNEFEFDSEELWDLKIKMLRNEDSEDEVIAAKYAKMVKDADNIKSEEEEILIEKIKKIEATFKSLVEGISLQAQDNLAVKYKQLLSEQK